MTVLARLRNYETMPAGLQTTQLLETRSAERSPVLHFYQSQNVFNRIISIGSCLGFRRKRIFSWQKVPVSIICSLALSLTAGCGRKPNNVENATIVEAIAEQGVTTAPSILPVTDATQSTNSPAKREAARAIFEDIASKNSDGELFFGVSYTQMMTYHGRGYIKGLRVTQQQATNASLTGTPSRLQETEKPAATTAATTATTATAATAITAAATTAAITAVTTEFGAPTLSTGSSVPAPVPRLEQAVDKRNVITVGYREQQ